MRGVYRVSVEKPEGKRPLRRPRCRWEDLQEVGFVAWTGLISYRIRKGCGLL